MLIPHPVPMHCYAECKQGGFNGHANSVWGQRWECKFSYCVLAVASALSAFGETAHGNGFVDQQWTASLSSCRLNHHKQFVFNPWTMVSYITVYAIYFASLFCVNRDFNTFSIEEESNGRRNQYHSLICTCTVYCTTSIAYTSRIHALGSEVNIFVCC